MKSLLRKLIAFVLLLTGYCWAAGAQHRCPQQPLPVEKADIAFVFIGGFGDGSTGIVHQLYQLCPPLQEGRSELRGYYHWDGDDMQLPWPRVAGVMADVLRFRELNPQSPIVVVGHSLGAVAALELAARVPHLYLVTLDPVDRESSRQRPKQVKWWGHAYVSHSASGRDFIFSAAGRWGSCSLADVNKNCDGRKPHELGRCYIHDYAYDLFLSRGEAEKSLFELLQGQLQIASPQLP